MQKRAAYSFYFLIYAAATEIKYNAGKPRDSRSWKLLRFLLLLLADADLEVLKLGFLERFVIVARHDVVEIGVHVGILGQDRHYREALVAGGAKWAKALNVGDCHTFLVYHGKLTRE
jgi:hypothetical protein